MPKVIALRSIDFLEDIDGTNLILLSYAKNQGLTFGEYEGWHIYMHIQKSFSIEVRVNADGIKSLIGDVKS